MDVDVDVEVGVEAGDVLSVSGLEGPEEEVEEVDDGDIDDVVAESCAVMSVRRCCSMYLIFSSSAARRA